MKKMVANKIMYFFNNDSVKHAFEACYNAIWSELTTAQAMNFSEICTISENEHSDELFEDDEILVDEKNLQECIEFFVDEYHIDTRSLFMSDEYIKERAEELLTRLRSDEQERITYDFSVTFEKNSDLYTLFNVLYAQREYYENRETSFDEFENIIQYDDFDYNEFFDAIDDILVPLLNEGESVEFDHVGGDSNSDNYYLDLYYQFNIKLHF